MLMQYDPWGAARRVSDELSNQRRRATLEGAVQADWSPSVDVREQADSYVLVADIPGVDPDAIEITVEKGVLTIKGERALVQNETLRRVERRHGKFERRFSLPDTADLSSVSAVGKNGVLTVTIPKREGVQPRRIQVAA